MVVKWTPNAKLTFHKTIDFIYLKWSQKDVANFIRKVEKIIEQIKLNPYMFVATSKNKQVRKGYISRQTRMLYEVVPRKNEIHILLFWDNRQNPAKNHYQ